MDVLDIPLLALTKRWQGQNIRYGVNATMKFGLIISIGILVAISSSIMERFILIMGVPFSVDDDRVGSHTELFWKGTHKEEEIINLIKNDPFLSKQFNLK